MKLKFAGTSQVGQVRRKNEDAILIKTSNQGALFLVADGIGGKEHGNLVSGMLRDRYNDWWDNRFIASNMNFQEAIPALKEVLFQVNREIVNDFGRFNAGSTLALLFLFQGHCLYLSSGDSRIYLARKLSLQQITVDDVYENLKHSPTEFQQSSKGKLVGAIGIRETPEFSIRTGTFKKRDRFLLCSDGAYRFLHPKNLRKYMLFPWRNPSQMVDTALVEIEKNGAKDNYSLIYICVDSL